MNEIILDDIKNKIVSNINPKAIILFGSMAREEDNEDSDIDLLIIWDEEKEFSNVKRRIKLRKIIGLVDRPIDIITLSTKELNDALVDKNSFTSLIMKEGKIIYGRLN